MSELHPETMEYPIHPMVEEIKIKRKPGMPVFENPGVPTTLIPPEQLQKHKEIKRMAWEFCNTNYKNLKKMHSDNEQTRDPIWYCIEMSWQMAEEFYNHAKEKQEGNENEKM